MIMRVIDLSSSLTHLWAHHLAPAEVPTSRIPMSSFLIDSGKYEITTNDLKMTVKEILKSALCTKVSHCLMSL